MERMIPPKTSELLGGTVGDELDRIDIKIGKIGLNSSAQSIELLSEMDAVNTKISSLPQGKTRQELIAQFEGSQAKLIKEANQFIRDAGGIKRISEAREKAHPGPEQSWWYLDQMRHAKRQAQLRRVLTTGSIIVVALIVLSVLYNRFLAPDPQVTALYSSEQSARDNMMAENLPEALASVEKGLAIDPQDATLLILKGVILEGLNRGNDAQASFNMASKSVSKEDFFLLRGQAYIMINQTEKAMIDSQEAIKNNPDSAQGYLLLGQVNETVGQSKTALDNYQKAFEISDKQQQYELAALARTRMAMLMQSMNTQITPPAWMLTPTTSGN
jgi:tetratricopeptide (TPR) repeat protein